MPTANLTVTARVGPAVQNTALSVTGVQSVNYDFVRQVAQVYVNSQPNPKEFDLSTVTTLTIVLAAGVYTLVLS